LLHPAQAFEHPSDVVNDPDLTLNEKRAILASWASDACAPEAAPRLRCAPGLPFRLSSDVGGGFHCGALGGRRRTQATRNGEPGAGGL
jgi:hypothetical protein